MNINVKKNVMTKKLRSYLIFQWTMEVFMNTMNDLIYAFGKTKE